MAGKILINTDKVGKIFAIPAFVVMIVFGLSIAVIFGFAGYDLIWGYWYMEFFPRLFGGIVLFCIALVIVVVTPSIAYDLYKDLKDGQ